MSLPRTLRALTRPATALPRACTRKTGLLTCQRYKSGPYGYTQAKALVYSKYGEPKDVLSLHTHSISPSLPPTSILLRALASPINPADINQVQGVYPTKPPFTSLIGTPSPSAVAGNEGCFEVLSVGSKITSLSKGDWIILASSCFGTFRTHALANENDVLRIENKEGLTPVQVGTVSVNPCTAYRLLRDFEKMGEGDWFIQNGANSGVGRAAIQLGRYWGLKSINVIRDRADAAATEELKEELYALGATKVITDAELMEKEFPAKLKTWTQQIKLGLNCVGGKPTNALMKCFSPSAHLVTYGGMTKQPLQLPTSALIFKDIKFRGFWVSKWSEENPKEKRRMVNEILDFMREGKFREGKVREIRWEWGTEEGELKETVQGTLEGGREGKGVFVFDDT